ncbi:hypothetical protein HU745_25170 [Pseudomonas mosselii]|uniref:hypothetical protein n=1 Tax=Pseudomonas mosselii TaxID=78327 RepID=UPI0016458C40|nr:hypothetical protein [Pseudomonas mosselii]MBC3454352.1 hypothetical protein [Pseudomonas mosselii]
MSIVTLPSALLAFFEATERKIDELYKPEWLISSLEDPVWLVNGSVDLREVSGKIKGAVTLRWDKMLWNGSLVDPLFSKVLYQAKLIIVLAFDGTFQKLGNTLKTISAFHAFIFRVIEYLDYRYGNAFHAEGFKVLTVDDIEEILELSMESGVSGSGFWVERIKYRVSGELGKNVEHQAVVDFFDASGVYDRNGKISVIQIGRIINVEPRRLSKSSSFIAYLAKFERNSAEPFCTAIAQKTVAQLANWFATFTQILISSPIETALDIQDESRVMDLVRQFRNPVLGRTKSMPRSVARILIRECCRWIEDFSQMHKYIDEVVSLAIKLRTRHPSMTEYDALVTAESQLVLPASLGRIRNFFCENEASSDRSDDHFLAPPFSIKLTRFHSAVSFVLIAILSCSRRREVLEIGQNDSIEKCGRKYINISLRKTGIDAVRVKFAKPVPNLVDVIIRSLDESPLVS